MTKVLSLDFELASILDLNDVGSDVWTKHPSTVPILAGFALDFEEPRAIGIDLLGLLANVPLPVAASAEAKAVNDAIITAHALRDKLLKAVEDPDVEIWAWNANFEWSVWNNIMARHLGWPELPIDRFHCTMATAACAGLPMTLDDAAAALNCVNRKDAAGHFTMKRMARPRKIEVNGAIHWWHREDVGKVKDLIRYNLADVRVEREIHTKIPRMTKRERRIWLADQAMNSRGLPVDSNLLTQMHALTLQELLRINADITTLTNGDVSGSTQNLKLLAWVRARGYPHNTLERDTLLEFVQTSAFNQLGMGVQAVLRFRAEASKTSTAKLTSIANYAQIDGYARNMVQYGAAVRTLRWGGRGPQIQNFPKPVIRKENVLPAIDEILAGMDAEGLRLLYGNPLDVVSSCLRGAFKAPAGHKLVIADYSAIEAIVLAWLAEDEDLLDVFRRGEDIYLHTAKAIGSKNRTLGKVMRLALGYGMGPAKFVDTAKLYGITLSLVEARDHVANFRLTNPKIVQLWHVIEDRARRAIQSGPGLDYSFKRLSFRMADPKGRLAGSLLMKLPSGRYLVYRAARLDGGRIMYWGVNQVTRHWEEMDTYGGKLVENAVQSIARDLLAEAVVQIEDTMPGCIRTTVHDEILAMARDDDAKGLLFVMQTIMGSPPAWGAGLPLSSAGAVVERYGKL